ncbi:MAG TPA: GNAT family N-acetyltransferase [Pyrinomonadaceae bacterium]|nr:GNAT family N-acetyltransferase [Pyrinomonadaceae bacterium]
MEEIELTFEAAPREEDLRVVRRGLISYNEARLTDNSYDAFNLILRDREGTVVGGLLGNAYWGWLYVDVLWVSEALRGRGYGRRLLLAAEAAALEKGYHSVYLDTFDFQSPGFYQKLGYEVFGTLDNFAGNHTRYFLRKTLKEGMNRNDEG